MTIVEINRVFKQYGQDLAVRGVDLRIGDGEFLVLVGPSGCGKTSILRMVAGLETISAGEILVDGAPVVDVHRGERRIGMIFQDPTLYPHMTVRENLGLPLKIAGSDRRSIDRDVDAMANLLGVRDLLARRPRQLSGGQRQRVAMGRALIRGPELLLMDEPMSHVDAKLRGELRATIGHLHQQFRITTLYVTHDQVEAMSLGDRIAVMRHGRIVQIGTPDDLYHRPVDAFVATFIGYPAMNLFVATVAGSGGDTWLDVGSSALRLPSNMDPLLRRRIGRELVVGVRPQSFRFDGHGLVVDVDRADVRADRVELHAALNVPSASVTLSGVAIGGRPTRLIVDRPADDDVDLVRWRPSHLTVDPQDIHLFDPSTGRSLIDEHSVAGTKP